MCCLPPAGMALDLASRSPRAVVSGEDEGEGGVRKTEGLHKRVSLILIITVETDKSSHTLFIYTLFSEFPTPQYDSSRHPLKISFSLLDEVMFALYFGIIVVRPGVVDTEQTTTRP